MIYESVKEKSASEQFSSDSNAIEKSRIKSEKMPEKICVKVEENRKNSSIFCENERNEFSSVADRSFIALFPVKLQPEEEPLFSNATTFGTNSDSSADEFIF